MYTIDQEKLEQITELYNEADLTATEYDVSAFICNDWLDETHQEWIDTASAQEIADWMIACIFC